MGTYVQFQAKPGCADKLNERYVQKCPGDYPWIVYSARVIADEIRFIHSPEGASQAHLRPYLQSVADWSRIFPALREGTGQIKISGIGDEARRDVVKRAVLFLLTQQSLLSSIEGLDDARRLVFYEEDEGEALDPEKGTDPCV